MLFPAQLLQNFHGGLHPVVVKAHQRIVQNQGSLRCQHLGHRQPEGEIQLVYGAAAAPQGFVEGVLS